MLSLSDARLTEQEALEHIKQLYAELQNLHDRVPPRGIAVATISSLLDSCRTSNQLKPPIKSALTNSILVRSDKSTNTTFVIDLKPNGNGIAHLSITDEKCAVLSLQKSVDEKENQNQIKDTVDKSPFLNLPLECMCTCDGVEMDDRINNCEHSSMQMMCSHYSNNTNEHSNQQQTDQNDKRCNDNSRKLNDDTKNCIVSSGICERCSRNRNNSNIAECCSSKCDCTKSFQTNSCSVHLSNKSNKNVNLVSAKSLDDDDGIGSDSNEISALLNKPDVYDKIGLSISESFENTEAEAAHVLPTTPSPIISISSGGDDDRLNRDNQTPSLVSPIGIENDDEKLSTVRDSCSSNNISLTTDASGTSTSTGNGAGKRGKTDAKLVLDLNDRSKYTKEVSV